MKLFAFAVLGTIPYVSLKKINTFVYSNYNPLIYPKLTSLLSKRSLASSVWSIILKDYISLYSLILGTSVNTEERCRSFLKELCKDVLKKLPKGSFSTRLLTMCGPSNILTYCYGLMTKKGDIGKSLLEKCNGMKTKLEHFLNKKSFVEKDNKRLEIEDCENYQTLCNIFHGICHDFINDICLKFTETCYTKFREDYRNSILLKMVNTSFKKHKSCVENILKKCHCVTSFGPEFTKSCFSINETCQDYIESTKQICSYLNSYIQDVFLGKPLYITGYKESLSRNKCSLLSVCNYYLSLCDKQTIKDYCKIIEKECSTKSDSDMYFIKQLKLGDCELTFKDINLTLFFSGEKLDGVLSPHKTPFLTPLLIYISSIQETNSSLEEKCKMFLKNECIFHKGPFPNLDEYCKNNYTDECNGMDDKVKESCQNLNKTLWDLGLISSQNFWHILWNGTNNITMPQCQAFAEDCTYFNHTCNGIQELCKNLQTLCYGLGIKRYNLNNFWQKLREKLPSGHFNILNPQELSDDSNLHKYISELCANYGEHNEILFKWCLYPILTQITSTTSLFEKLILNFLSRYNDLKRDFNCIIDKQPTLAECAYYVSECNGLSGLFKDLNHNCTTLKNICIKSIGD